MRRERERDEDDEDMAEMDSKNRWRLKGGKSAVGKKSHLE